jgi:outer membrane protein assembly factor BamA
MPLFWTFYGALSGSVGRFFNTAIEDDARVFYQGGSRSVRGYRFRSIFASYTTSDTTTVTNKETGKDSSVVKDNIHTALTPMYFRINEELRWTFPWKSLRAWQIVQFFDWARVMDVKDNTYGDAQEGSIGLGIRYHWQFLTFRLDYAIITGVTSLDENKKNSTKFKWGRFAFDLSQAF